MNEDLSKTVLKEIRRKASTYTNKNLTRLETFGFTYEEIYTQQAFIELLSQLKAKNGQLTGDMINKAYRLASEVVGVPESRICGIIDQCALKGIETFFTELNDFYDSRRK